MSGDIAFRRALGDAIARVAEEHLPHATGAGRVSGFLLAFDWLDVSAAAGEHIVVHGRDPKIAVRAMSRSILGDRSAEPRLGRSGD